MEYGEAGLNVSGRAEEAIRRIVDEAATRDVRWLYDEALPKFIKVFVDDWMAKNRWRWERNLMPLRFVPHTARFRSPARRSRSARIHTRREKAAKGRRT